MTCFDCVGFGLMRNRGKLKSSSWNQQFDTEIAIVYDRIDLLWYLRIQKPFIVHIDCIRFNFYFWNGVSSFVLITWIEYITIGRRKICAKSGKLTIAQCYWHEQQKKTKKKIPQLNWSKQWRRFSFDAKCKLIQSNNYNFTCIWFEYINWSGFCTLHYFSLIK